MNKFINNQKGWSALLLLPGLTCSGFSYAAPDIQGKSTHEIATLENGASERHNRSEPLRLTLSVNDGYRVENGLDIDYFRIYHTSPDNDQYVLNEDLNSASKSNSGYLEITIPDEWESGLHCFSAAAMSDGVEGGRTAQQCITLYSEASNLFKTGALTDQPTHLSTSYCLPRGIYSKWHKEIYSSPESTRSYNGHILGVSQRSFAVDGKLTYQLDGGGTKRCELEDTDLNAVLGPKEDENGNPIFDDDGNPVLEVKERTRRVRVTPDVRTIVHQDPDDKNAMLYVKTHACAIAGNSCVAGDGRNRAEISYDRKKEADATYTDGATHTQEGDVFWVTYRFNAVNLFEHANSADVPANTYVYLSQFHPDTVKHIIEYLENENKTCNGTCGHAPTFGMLLAPIFENGNVNANKAELVFRTKHIKENDDLSTEAALVNLGESVVIDLKKWYQIKIGIKFSTNDDPAQGDSGWAVAAYREEGGTWNYFKETGVQVGSGSLFRGQTLHAAPCRYEKNGQIIAFGNKGNDCQSNSQKHFETVFKFGGYYDGDLWKGSVDNHLEILFDDIYSFDSHHEPTFNEWPDNLGASNDPLKSDIDIENNIKFTKSDILKTDEKFPQPYVD